MYAPVFFELWLEYLIEWMECLYQEFNCFY